MLSCRNSRRPRVLGWACCADRVEPVTPFLRCTLIMVRFFFYSIDKNRVDATCIMRRSMINYP
jgi:hypothetical protein